MKIVQPLSIIAAVCLIQSVIAALNSAAVDTESFQMVYTDLMQDLLHIKKNSNTNKQQLMYNRIMNENKVCTNNMVCMVDALVRNVTRDLVNDGITNVSEQLDGKKFDYLLTRLLTALDKDVFLAYLPYITETLDQSAMELLWKEGHANFKSSIQMVFALNDILMNPQNFVVSQVVSPFIIADERLKKHAIQRLITSPNFQLKPLNSRSKFHHIQERLKASQKQNEMKKISTDMDESSIGTVTIPLKEILNFTALPELNSTDVANTTIIIDQSNGNILQFIMDQEQMMLINAVLMSLLGDLLGVILDLPGKLLGSGGKGGSSGDGLTITIGLGLGGNKGDTDEDDEPGPTSIPRKRPPM